MIRKALVTDANRITEIYNHYVTHTAITFETQTVSTTYMVEHIDSTIKSDYPFYVYEHAGKVVGYIYLSPWHKRHAYDTTAELSVYVDHCNVGQGIGKAMISYLLDVADRNRFHSIIACVALPNESSIAIHEKFGFKQISHFREVGHKFNQWQDVGHWQLIMDCNK